MLSRRLVCPVLVLSTVVALAGPVGAEPAPADDLQLRHDEPVVRPASVQATASVAGTCPWTITDDLTLDQDLHCHATVRGGPEGLTVDLAGHTWHGSFVIESPNVTITNGTVAPTDGTAVFDASSGTLLDGLTVRGGHGFVVEAGSGLTVRDSTFVDNRGIAVDQFYAGGLTVTGSTFVGNNIGVSIQGSAGARIEGNSFRDNQVGVNVWDEDGVEASGTLIADNHLRDNRFGVRVAAEREAHGTTIVGNHIADSAASGIRVTSDFTESLRGAGGAAGTVIRDNVVLRSGHDPVRVTGCLDDADPELEPACSTDADDGITVLGWPSVVATMTVADNRALHNAGHGIEAPGVRDGGGNVAVRNGAGQCLGVVCRP